jgi:hypothetical protein
MPEGEWNQGARVRAGNFQVAGNRDARPDVTRFGRCGATFSGAIRNA